MQENTHTLHCGCLVEGMVARAPTERQCANCGDPHGSRADACTAKRSACQLSREAEEPPPPRREHKAPGQRPRRPRERGSQARRRPRRGKREGLPRPRRGWGWGNRRLGRSCLFFFFLAIVVSFFFFFCLGVVGRRRSGSPARVGCVPAWDEIWLKAEKQTCCCP